jgi:hypothetical protein
MEEVAEIFEDVVGVAYVFGIAMKVDEDFMLYGRSEGMVGMGMRIVKFTVVWIFNVKLVFAFRDEGDVEAGDVRETVVVLRGIIVFGNVNYMLEIGSYGVGFGRGWEKKRIKIH